MIPAIDQALP